MSTTRIQHGYGTLNKRSVLPKFLVFEFIPLTSLCILRSLLLLLLIWEYSHVSDIIS